MTKHGRLTFVSMCVKITLGTKIISENNCDQNFTYNSTQTNR